MGKMGHDQKILGFLETKFKNEFRKKISIEAQPPLLVGFPEQLNAKLQKILESEKIYSLYSHQLDAFQKISQGQDTLLVSRTASGKTISFMLPILNEYIHSKQKFTTLFLYPTKALSRDQESTLGKLLKASTTSRFGTFDGDTSKEERENLVKYADFIITNPDMLHSGILPNHNRKWRNFLKRLKYIVIDEVHTYRGAFGSHVSNVFRRLLRICSMHGSSPTFVCSSATIGNPLEHTNKLFHREFQIIDKDGSPTNSKNIIFLNPALLSKPGEISMRKGPSSISAPLIRFAAQEGIRTICFCRARQEVERLHRIVVGEYPFLEDKVKPYRGGLLPMERRKLEQDLFSGKINTIITTNALELGIDIGDMSLCILNGHPGSISSFWQQAGRVGRKGSDATIVFIAKDLPIDQYIIHHPEYITNTPSEEAWLSADNPYILLQHLPCAAYEYPLSISEKIFSDSIYPLAIQTLLESNNLSFYKDVYRYNSDDYPSKGVNLRGMTDYNITIVNDGKVIGEIDPLGAMGTLHKDAIYQHLGRKFISQELDLEKKICNVQSVHVDYFTEAVWENMVTMKEVDEEKNIHDSIVQFGLTHVSMQPKLYKKIKERSFENIGYGPITLPSFQYDTMGLLLILPDNWIQSLNAIDARYPDLGLHGLSYILKNIAPSICMGDISDIHTDVSIGEGSGQNWKNALYLYDSIEGGVGYSEKIFEKITEVLEICKKVLEECECLNGCPACVPPSPPSYKNQDFESILLESNATTECTKSLIIFLLEGNFVAPEIIFLERITHPPNWNSQADEKLTKDLQRLKRSIDILNRKKERLH
jgi:DEAD/DEAH box helicase domain-containing protein